ncbi:cutinase family protein [Actinoallomurus acanthiterrae]
MHPRSLLAAALIASGLAAVAPATAHAATCSDAQFVDARGTGEPGTLGAIVGDPVYSALQQKITAKSWSAYAVNYPADLSSGSASKGNTDLVDHLKAQAAACPAQTFVLGGYSQGANVVDNSMGISSDGAVVGGPITETIPATIEPKVKAVLLFGNPIRAIGRSVTGTYQARTLDLCASGDPVCGAGTNILAHLSYGGDAGQAATFAAARL